MALTPVEIEVEGERHQATPPVVLGRARGAGSQDALAVKDADGRALYVFKGVYASITAMPSSPLDHYYRYDD
ncbi:MAG: hypothetical protein RRB51_11405, partial [Thermoproteus sp.]|nr:hypothetical protein [Thermoproteus sp.]